MFPLGNVIKAGVHTPKVRVRRDELEQSDGELCRCQRGSLSSVWKEVPDAAG